MDRLYNFSDYETATLTVGSSSASVQFKLPGSPKCRDCMVSNQTTAWIYIAFGVGTATADQPGNPGDRGEVPRPDPAVAVFGRDPAITWRTS